MAEDEGDKQLSLFPLVGVFPVQGARHATPSERQTVCHAIGPQTYLQHILNMKAPETPDMKAPETPDIKTP